ncbi:MAG: YopN family type III secretion system gatekeeper subunit [Sulfitobacter sp.]|nr:YopN family type III secretion system gatekeeper subunit [Sulfitobacter sp.]
MPGPISSDFNQPSGIGANAGVQTSKAPVQGAYRGERVVAQSQTSLIEDAAEELTSSIGEHQEKELSKRDIKEGKRSDQLDRIMKLKHIEEMVNNLKDMRKEDLQRVLAQLTRMKNATPRQLREHAREEFKEPAHQFAALSALVEGLKDQGAPKQQIEAAEAALQQLMDEEGPAVNAGINVSPTAEAFSSESLGDVQDLRDAYRDAVLDYQGMSEAYDSLLEKYGPDDLAHAIKYLMEGLGADMSAKGSSLEKSKLNAILNDMYRLEVLTGMLEACDDLVQKTKNQGATTPIRGSDLLKEVLDMQQDKWLRPEKIRPLPQKMGVQGILGEINFLREFKGLARDIPEKAYAEPEQRQRFLDAIQTASDEAIEIEESEED